MTADQRNCFAEVDDLLQQYTLSEVLDALQTWLKEKDALECLRLSREQRERYSVTPLITDARPKTLAALERLIEAEREERQD